MRNRAVNAVQNGGSLSADARERRGERWTKQDEKREDDNLGYYLKLQKGDLTSETVPPKLNLKRIPAGHTAIER